MYQPRDLVVICPVFFLVGGFSFHPLFFLLSPRLCDLSMKIHPESRIHTGASSRRQGSSQFLAEKVQIFPWQMFFSGGSTSTSKASWSNQGFLPICWMLSDRDSHESSRTLSCGLYHQLNTWHHGCWETHIFLGVAWGRVFFFKNISLSWLFTTWFWVLCDLKTSSVGRYEFLEEIHPIVA